MKYDLAISPCPNDTYIFYHLIHNGIREHLVRASFFDIEELNRRAIEEKKHQITKLSFPAMLKVKKEYNLLKCGSAIGRSCGPILISYKETKPSELAKKLKKVAIPGHWTTANFLLKLFLKNLKIVLEEITFLPMSYEKIIPALQIGEVDFGVIIHEERFTFMKENLSLVQDLGEWWEKETNLPIPLGCIAVRKDTTEDIKTLIEKSIQVSFLSTKNNPTLAWPFIKKHAQSLSNEAIQAHIALYVNDFTREINEEGNKAIQELFQRIENSKI